MEQTIVTISREYGSGGRQVGKKLAETLGLAYYDKEMIALIAKESGLAETFVEELDRKRTASFLYNLYMTSQSMPISEQVYLVQSRLIRELAKKESFVIIGRCADHVLAENPHVTRVFTYAPADYRVAYARTALGDAEATEDTLRKQDKRRASYYNFFTQQTWGAPHNYHLLLDTSCGVDAAADLLRYYLEQRRP